jgi:hypothetical protein
MALLCPRFEMPLACVCKKDYADLFLGGNGPPKKNRTTKSPMKKDLHALEHEKKKEDWSLIMV